MKAYEIPTFLQIPLNCLMKTRDCGPSLGDFSTLKQTWISFEDAFDVTVFSYTSLQSQLWSPCHFPVVLIVPSHGTEQGVGQQLNHQWIKVKCAHMWLVQTHESCGSIYINWRLLLLNHCFHCELLLNRTAAYRWAPGRTSQVDSVYSIMDGNHIWYPSVNIHTTTLDEHELGRHTHT